MGEEAPTIRNTSLESAMSHMLSWITTAGKNVGNACVHYLTGPAAGPLLFACIGMLLAHRFWKKDSHQEARPTRILHRSISMAALHGGRVAMQRIIDSAKVRTEEGAVENAMRQMQTLLAQRPLRFSELQRAAAKLEMSGKEDEAVEMLHKAWERADKDGKQHEAHELQMLLVEMLIYKGEYSKALGCKCLQDKEISDARGPLYKAVIYTILKEAKKAEDCYKEFQTIRSQLLDLQDSFKEGSMVYKAMHEFDEFTENVDNLKKEIEHAHKVK